MRILFNLLILLTLAAGCALAPNGAPAAPTKALPPTSVPTAVPEPIATNTLVVQDAPVQRPTAANARRYPAPSTGPIGVWVDAAMLPLEEIRYTSSLSQLAVGPQALVSRQFNWRVIALARLDAAQPDNLVTRAVSLTQAYDGVLLEHSAANTLQSADALLASLRTPLNNRLLVASTYAWDDGAAYAAHAADAQALLKRVDGVCLCSFLRASDSPTQTYKSEVEWKKDVDALARLSNSPTTFTLVSTPFAKLLPAEREGLEPWFRYALASFLLGANGSRVYFSMQGRYADKYLLSIDIQTLLGSPRAGYYSNYGLYIREFQKGIVFVNPGANARQMVLPPRYISPTDEAQNRVKVDPHSGMIVMVPQ